MTTYNSQKILLKNNKEIIVRNLEPIDAEQYFIFSEKIASETTHTLHYSGQFTAVEILKEKWLKAIKSTWQLELGGFDDGKLVSHLSFYKPLPHHPYEKHTAEFGIRILKDYCFHGLGSKKLLIMENIARGMEIVRIQAKVRTSNYTGLNFFQKYGYEIEGIKKCAAFINGEYENEFYIAKVLNELRKKSLCRDY